MMVELMTTPRSRIEAARYWGEIAHLTRPCEYTGPRDIIVVGNVLALRWALSSAGIAATVRMRMVVIPRDYRIDRVIVGARVTARRVGDVARMVEIATDLGVLVAEDPDAGSHRRG